MQVHTLDGEPASTASIPDEKPLVLYYFNTECIFCQETFTDLPNHKELMEEATLLFVSDENPGLVREFITDMELDDGSEIQFYVDADQHVKEHFAVRGVPAIYLYDKEGELIELYRGATALTNIRSELQKKISSR